MPGLKVYKRRILYWDARTQPVCGKSEEGGARERTIIYVPSLPCFQRAEESLTDLVDYQSANRCEGCMKCFHKKCKVFGQEPDAKRINDVFQLKFDG